MADLHHCPGCGRRIVPHHRFACRPCWYRLPAAMRHAITDNWKRDVAAHRTAMRDASLWYRDNPPPPPPTPEDAAAAIADLMKGTGQHAGHERRQIGPCVVCSCGQRYQGQLSKEAGRG